MRELLAWAFSLMVAGCATSGRAAERPPDSPEQSTAHAPHHGGGAHGATHPSAVSDSDPQHPTADHRFEDAERWSKVFDDPKRDEWQRPAALVAELAIQPDEVVVDLGTGTGYFVEALSQAVPRGQVIAVDLEPNLLKFVEQRVAKGKLKNVVTRLAEKDDPKLVERLDLVLVVDTYHHIGQRSSYFKKLSKQLSERGRVVIVDFRMGRFPVGPDDSHKLAPDVVEREMKLGGYALCKSWNGLPYQYVLTFATRCVGASR